MSNSDYSLTPVDGDPFAGQVSNVDPIDTTFKDAIDYAGGLAPTPAQPMSHTTFEKAMPYGNLQEAQDTSQGWPTRIAAGLGYEAASKIGGLGQAAWSAFTLPGDVAQGKVDPNSDEAIRRSADLAGMISLPADGAIVSEQSPLKILGRNGNSPPVTLTPVDGNPFESSATNSQAWPQRFGPDENPPVRELDGTYNLQDYNNPRFPEHVVMPAIHAPDGNLYIGANRSNAMQNAISLGGFSSNDIYNRIVNDPGSSGFITSRGRFVGQNEGSEIEANNERSRNDYLNPDQSQIQSSSDAVNTKGSVPAQSSPWQDFLDKNNMTEESFGDAMLGKYGRNANGEANYQIDPYAGGAKELSSPIYDPDTGSSIGNMERVINPNTNSAYHALLRLNNSTQGSGVAKDLLSQQIQNYQNWGINKVGIYAGLDVGGYAWSKYGFVPKWNAINDIASEANSRLQNLYDKGALDQNSFDDVKNTIDNAVNNPKGMWDISDINTPLSNSYRPNPKTDTVGKYLLQGQSWPGELDLTDPETMERFNSYVSKRKKP